MSDTRTIFKKIIDGDIPAKIVYQDEHCLAFHDIAPQAPLHVLIIPKREIASLNDLTPSEQTLLGHIWTVIPKLASQLGVADSGYRVACNCGRDGGQTVHHLHFHLLAGRPLAWPPG